MFFFEKILDFFQGKILFGSPRSSKWRKVRNEHLKEFPYCSVCLGDEKLRVHHIKPFHLFPSLELEKSNLVTLCERKKYGINCHLLIGHLGNFRRMNDTCKRDIVYWFNKLNT